MAINYTGVDLDRYNAGNKFYSQDRFLQGIGLDKPAITFNPSQSNTGIMNAYNPYPIIPQYDGGDDDGGGGGPKGPGGRTDAGEGFGGGYGDLSRNAFDEEKDVFGGFNFNTAKNLGMFAFNPFGFAIGKGLGYLKNKFNDYRENKRNDQGGYYGDDNYSGGLKGNVTQKGPGRSFSINDPNAGGSQNEDESSSGGGYDGGQASSKGDEDMAYGGRAGYSGGGLSRAQIVSLKNLGYDIDKKGMEPFGGIDILKDILRLNKYANGGRAGYKDGYSVQDDMTDYATNVGKEASPGGGFQDSGGNNNSVNNINIPTGTSNLDFNLRNYTDPTVSYSNNFGRFGGILDTTRTIQEEEPVGNIGYLDPSGNLGIGFNTDLGVVGNANLGNLNIGYTGQDGFNANYMGGFDGDAGRFGANYGKDGLEARMTYNKKFNSGGIVGMYR